MIIEYIDSNPHVPISKNAGGETCCHQPIEISVGKYDPNVSVSTIRRVWDRLNMGRLTGPYQVAMKSHRINI